MKAFLWLASWGICLLVIVQSIAKMIGLLHNGTTVAFLIMALVAWVRADRLPELEQRAVFLLVISALWGTGLAESLFLGIPVFGILMIMLALSWLVFLSARAFFENTEWSLFFILSLGAVVAMGAIAAFISSWQIAFWIALSFFVGSLFTKEEVVRSRPKLERPQILVSHL